MLPTYCQKKDMIRIQGMETDDFWFGEVVNVHQANKTVSVYFYIRHSERKKDLIRESTGKTALNTVDWDSVLSLCTGKWGDNNVYILEES